MRLSRLPSLLSRAMSTGTKPVAPRPSASLVVINERDEVLLVHRNHTASTFAGVHVRCVAVLFVLVPSLLLGLSWRQL